MRRELGTGSMKNNNENYQNNKNGSTIRSGNSIARYLPKEHEDIYSKIYMHNYFYCCAT